MNVETFRSGVKPPLESPVIRSEWLDQLAAGEWRTPIYYEMIKAEIDRVRKTHRPTVLDIGCGRGFDGETRYQQLIAEDSANFIGVEPDASVKPVEAFTQVFHTTFEDAPIPAHSVDVAFAVMVMEHVRDPVRFWGRLAEILVPGGVFIAFTVNGGHWFSTLTKCFNAVGLKTLYLNTRYGLRGVDRYLDYPVYYRTNTKSQVARYTKAFSSVDVVPCGQIGIVAAYAPWALRALVRSLDHLVYLIRRNRINLIIRAVRAPDTVRPSGAAGNPTGPPL